ncbi:MAG: LysM peptidoglycan-binding domain-containing protein [Clostridia bacterium]|nr:LysM peptidoglycan-binding domain-containing protein [Clostridia bacterium]
MQIKLLNENKPWFYTVKKADEMEIFNLSKFSQKFNFDISEFESLNGKINKISYGDVLVIPPSQKYYHVVQPTETLTIIANNFNVSEEYLKTTNKINKIFIGQKIFI